MLIQYRSDSPRARESLRPVPGVIRRLPWTIFADPGLRQPSRLGEPVLADSQRLKELGEKDLAGSDGVVHLRAH